MALGGLRDGRVLLTESWEATMRGTRDAITVPCWIHASAGVIAVNRVLDDTEQRKSGARTPQSALRHHQPGDQLR